MDWRIPRRKQELNKVFIGKVVGFSDGGPLEVKVQAFVLINLCKLVVV